MNKDFSKAILLNMNLEKKLKVLHDLASFIQLNEYNFNSNHFKKLKKYHEFLYDDSHESIQILNKEFLKIQQIDFQFEVYLMNLERLLGQSTAEYQFLVQTKDKIVKQEKKLPIICVMDSIRSAHNVGAMLRNAECFNIEKCIMTGLTPTSDHPAVIKTAMGCNELIDSEYHKSAIKYLQEMKMKGYQIWGVETAKQASNIKDLKHFPEKLMIVFGHEKFGLSLEVMQICDKTVAIELSGQKNSLNVAIAQGIVLHHISCAYNCEL